MPGLTGAGTGTTIARAVMEEECSVLGRAGARAGWRGGHGVAEGRARGVPARADRTAAEHTPHCSVTSLVTSFVTSNMLVMGY